MKKYFYAKGNEQVGPFTLDELKHEDIKPDSLIWYEGLSNWEPAESLEDLRSIFELIPPPLENTQSDSSAENEKNFHDSLATFERKKQKMFSNVFGADGRIRRLEYGLSFIFFYFFVFFISLISQISGAEWMLIIFLFLYFPLLIIMFSQGAKRCHDLGNSGWFQIIPFYGLWMLFADGERGSNKYGPNPKGKL